MILRGQQCLLVIGKLHLRTQKIYAGRCPSIVLAFCQLRESLRIVYSRLSRIHPSGRRLRPQIETGNRADDQVTRVLVVQLARFEGKVARLPIAITLQIDDVLLGVNPKIVV